MSERVGMRMSSGWGTDRRPGRLGVFFIAIWTFFLLEPLRAGWDRRDQVSGWVGMLATLVFAVFYVAVALRRRQGIIHGPGSATLRPSVVAIAVAAVLAVVVCVSVGQSGTATAVYLCVLCVMTLPNPWSVIGAAVFAIVAYVAGSVVPGWDRDNTLLLSLLTASIAVWGIQQMLLGNAALRAATQENQRLAVADERNRFARDLHDILGHSLTVITVKAELAQRLLDVDPARARGEVADLERLARDALTDVRRAVEGYRELTLPGELARARAALATAEIEADLPYRTDEVPGDLRELFAWTVREGVTNVIRHSGARRCTVRITADAAEVADDGRGPLDTQLAQNGLRGLRERAAAAGATVVTGPAQPTGFRLTVVAPS